MLETLFGGSSCGRKPQTVELREGAFLRRLYSTFAGGWPGFGLLLMRLVVGLALLTHVGPVLWSDPPLTTTITCVFLVGGGILLGIGLWTPIVGILVTSIELWRFLRMGSEPWVSLFLGTIGAALAMLGPGLWSIDARLFGWKRVEPPPRKSSLKPS